MDLKGRQEPGAGCRAAAGELAPRVAAGGEWGGGGRVRAERRRWGGFAGGGGAGSRLSERRLSDRSSNVGVMDDMDRMELKRWHAAECGPENGVREIWTPNDCPMDRRIGVGMIAG